MSIYSTDAVGAFTQPHSHPGETLTLLHQGAAEIELPHGRETMAEGGVMRLPTGMVHSLRNLGPGALEMITIHLGAQFLREEG